MGSEPAGNELLGQEERDFLLLGKVVIMDMECAGQDKAGVLVKVDVPFHAKEADAHFAGLLQRIAEQLQPIALPFIVRVHADGAEGPGGLLRALIQDQFGLGEHHMADKTALLLHHEVQFRDEIRIAPVLIQHEVLRAAGAVNIPEGLPREVFHRAVFFGFLQSDFHSLRYFSQNQAERIAYKPPRHPGK